MKKILLLFFCLVLAIGNFKAAFAENKTISLFLDEKEVVCDPSPMLMYDRTMIPLRAVFEQMGASVSWDGEKRQVRVRYDDIDIRMTIDSDNAIVNTAEVTLDAPPVIVQNRTMIPLRFVAEAIGAIVSWDGRDYRVDITSPKAITPPVIISDVSFAKKSDCDLLSMTASGKVSVKLMQLPMPERIVLDLENALLLSRNAQNQGAFVREVRYAYHEDFMRVVAENDTMPRFVYTDNDGFISIRFYAEEKNFNYLGTEDKSILFPKGTSITYVKKENNTLVFTISGTKLSKETLTIDDGVVREIASSGKTLSVSLSGAATYSINGNVLLLHPLISTVTSDRQSKSGLVVLDAGHGGNDPGTLGYDEDGKTVLAKEKDINLAITKKVYTLLKASGVQVAMTRTTDVYVGLVERANFANERDAELFVSIHNNSIPDPEYHGSMVLYSLNSSGGKTLASNILTAMVSSAETENHGLRNGTNMAVIKRTIMPAVIVECGCLTNREELENLMDDAFLDKLAEGITEGIIKTLGK